MNLVRKNTDWFVPATVDRFVDHFFNGALPESNTIFTPNVDIAETDKSFEIQVAVPGFNKKDFNIDLNDGILTIAGERKLEQESKTKNFHTIQTQYGTFKKSFQLPDSVVQGKTEATYENGILTVLIPKNESKKLVSRVTVK